MSARRTWGLQEPQVREPDSQGRRSTTLPLWSLLVREGSLSKPSNSSQWPISLGSQIGAKLLVLMKSLLRAIWRGASSWLSLWSWGEQQEGRSVLDVMESHALKLFSRLLKAADLGESY